MKLGLGKKMIVGLGILLGFGGIALASTIDASASQLYRGYNPNTGEHLYTANSHEIPNIVGNGWRNEGNAWVAPSKGTPVYRLFNPNNGGDHVYTMNTYEVSMLKGQGWRYEGVSWQSGGSVPVYRLYNPNSATGTHHYTLYAYEKDNLVSKGWRYEGVGFYGEGNTSKPKPDPNEMVWTVWFHAAHEEDSKYNIEAGDKIFNTEKEAKSWIDNYATKLVMSEEMVSSDSYGYKQILKSDVN